MVGCFLDGQSELMLAAVRLRHFAGTKGVRGDTSTWITSRGWNRPSNCNLQIHLRTVQNQKCEKFLTLPILRNDFEIDFGGSGRKLLAKSPLHFILIISLGGFGLPRGNPQLYFEMKLLVLKIF